MAIWQFQVLLIPKAWAVKHDDNPALLLSTDGSIDTSVAWAGTHTLPEIFFNAFDHIFPRESSWHEDLVIWGNDKTTDIQIWIENGFINEINLRLHVGEDLEENVFKFIKTIEPLKCYLFIPEKKLIVDPSTQEILRLAMTSRAAAFVTNPQAYLRSLPH